MSNHSRRHHNGHRHQRRHSQPPGVHRHTADGAKDEMWKRLNLARKPGVTGIAVEGSGSQHHLVVLVSSEAAAKDACLPADFNGVSVFFRVSPKRRREPEEEAVAA